MVTDRPVDQAYKNLLQSILTFKEFYGAQGLRTFLQEELTREICLGEIAERNRRLIAAAEARVDEANANSADLLQSATGALEFYADAANYQRQGGKPSAVTADRGDIARAALEAIDDATNPENGDN